MVFALLLAVAVLGVRVTLFRKPDALPALSLRERLEDLFEPFAGRTLPADALAELERDADRIFMDAVTGVGLVPGPWHVRVHVDELFGPVPRVHGPEGQSLDVAEFEQRLRDRRIELA